MTNSRILKRVIFINSASIEYAEVLVDGHTCLIGTNNSGKTTFLRAVTFFYNPSYRKKDLGIKEGEKHFYEWYYDTITPSYLIYEVQTENGFFHVITYRKNSQIYFRFIDAPYDKAFYVNVDNQILEHSELVKSWNPHNISYTDEIDTISKYNGILYGGDLDKKQQTWKKYALIQGNDNYKNIPKIIKDIFLSSNPKFSTGIEANFVKEFIASAVADKITVTRFQKNNEKELSINLASIKVELDNFNKGYIDIEDFKDKRSQEKRKWISEIDFEIRQLKIEQHELALRLGNAVRFAEEQVVILFADIEKKEAEIDNLKRGFDAFSTENQEKVVKLNAALALQNDNLEKANTYKKHWDSPIFQAKWNAYQNKHATETERNGLQNEYNILTKGAQEITQQFEILFSRLKNEKDAYELAIKEKASNLDTEYKNEQSKVKDTYNEKEKVINEQFQKKLGALTEKIQAEKITFERLKGDRRVVSQTLYFETEINGVKNKQVDLVLKEQTRASDFVNCEKDLAQLKDKRESEIKDLAEKQKGFMTKNEADILSLREKIRVNTKKLHIQGESLYGFLSENVSDWKETIGKICHEDILFLPNLNPIMLEEVTKSLYGVNIDLSQLPLLAKSLAEYEAENNLCDTKIENLLTALNEFNQKHHEESQRKVQSFNKKHQELTEKKNVLAYEKGQNENEEKKLKLNLEEWQQKANDKRTEKLKEIGEQESLNLTLRKELSGQLDTLKTAQAKEIEILVQEQNEKLYDLTKISDENTRKIVAEREVAINKFDQREHELENQKLQALAGKGIDILFIEQLDKKIKALNVLLRNIEESAEKVIRYKGHKEEYIDKIAEFAKGIENISTELSENKSLLEKKQANYNAENQKITDRLNEIKKVHNEFLSDLKLYKDQFQGTKLYLLLAKKIIETNDDRVDSETNITKTIAELRQNDENYSQKIDDLRQAIAGFMSSFRNKENNILNFKSNMATNDEYLFFAKQLHDFNEAARINDFVMEVSKKGIQIIGTICSFVKLLIGSKYKIEKEIEKMEKEITSSSFVKTKLIEHFAMKVGTPENRVWNQLEKIYTFHEINGYLLSSNLFGEADKEINKNYYTLISDLREAIQNSQQREIRLQDIFEILFNIKEKKNIKTNIKKLEDIGSEGTTILIKSCIYISLLHLFLQSSTNKNNRNFKIHCIIDEIGKIHATYLRQLIEFAEQRNIYLFNGAPNASGVETAYHFNYKLKEDEAGDVSIVPLTYTFTI